MPPFDLSTFSKWFYQNKRLFWLFCLSSSFSIMHIGAVLAATPKVEYQIKASLIFNFIHFVTWPKSIDESSNPETIICLMGNDTYSNTLRALNGEIVQGKKIAIKKIDEKISENWAHICQVAVFTGHNSHIIKRDLSLIADSDVLTIGENNEFLNDGGIIKFTIIDDTVKFDINLDSATQARLKISSKLLRLANKVLDTEENDD